MGMEAMSTAMQQNNPENQLRMSDCPTATNNVIVNAISIIVLFLSKLSKEPNLQAPF